MRNVYLLSAMLCIAVQCAANDACAVIHGRHIEIPAQSIAILTAGKPHPTDDFSECSAIADVTLNYSFNSIDSTLSETLSGKRRDFHIQSGDTAMLYREEGRTWFRQYTTPILWIFSETEHNTSTEVHIRSYQSQHSIEHTHHTLLPAEQCRLILPQGDTITNAIRSHHIEHSMRYHCNRMYEKTDSIPTFIERHLIYWYRIGEHYPIAIMDSELKKGHHTSATDRISVYIFPQSLNTTLAHSENRNWLTGSISPKTPPRQKREIQHNEMEYKPNIYTWQNEIKIDIPPGDIYGYTLTISDIQGRVFTTRKSTGTETVTISGLPPGEYIINLTGAGQNQSTKILIQ